MLLLVALVCHRLLAAGEAASKEDKELAHDRQVQELVGKAVKAHYAFQALVIDPLKDRPKIEQCQADRARAVTSLKRFLRRMRSRM